MSRGIDVLLFILMLCFAAICLLMCIPSEVLNPPTAAPVSAPQPAFRAPANEPRVHLR